MTTLSYLSKLMRTQNSKAFYQRFLFILVATLLSLANLEAVTITSNSSGDWKDPGTWDTGTVPGASDDVIISMGHLIQLDIFHAPTFYECKSLTIQTLGGLLLLQSSFTVHERVDNNGGFILDSDGQGTNLFKGLVTNGPGGIFNISGVNNVSRNVFEGGFIHNGTTFNIEGCTFQGNNQVIGGTSPVAFTLRINIDNITLTNTNWAGLTIEPSSFISGLNAGATFRNEGLVYYQGQNPPMEIGTWTDLLWAIPLFTTGTPSTPRCSLRPTIPW
jgi:hypothetical protein